MDTTRGSDENRAVGQQREGRYGGPGSRLRRVYACEGNGEGERGCIQKSE